MQTATEINELPGNNEAELSLIGLTFVRGQVPSAAKVLATTDFYSPYLRDVWGACLELEEERQMVEPFAVHDILKRNNPGAAALWPVSSLANTSLGIPITHENVYVEKIRSASVRRFLIRKLYDGIQSLIAGEKGTIQSLRRELNDLEFTEEAKGNFTSLADIFEKQVKPALLDLRQGVTHKISTGFPAIDRIIGGGISLSDVMLVAGIPGGGKSAFVLQLTSNIAKQGIPVAFLSGEMSDKENAFRLLSQSSQTANLNSAVHLSDNDVEFYNKWVDALKTLPIYMDSRTYDLRTLSLSLRNMVENYGVKVLVIDYIQLMKLNRFDKHTRTERITETSQEVKRIAMEYGIAVIEVAQFNREGAKSGKPGMHDLEGSSQLEKDTSLIFIIDREEQSSNVTLRVVKGRNSGLSEVSGRFEGWKLSFEF